MKRENIDVFIFYETMIGAEDFKRVHPHPKFEFKSIPDELDAFYKIIDCTTIDIVVKRIGGRYYNIIVDDEGLFRDDPIITMVDPHNRNDALVGTLIICGMADDDGDLTSITEDDARHIAKYINFGLRNCKDGNNHIRQRLFPAIFINIDNPTT